MSARLSMSLHAVERAARRQMGVARHHAGSAKPASAGRSSATTARARLSSSSCSRADVWPTPTGREERIYRIGRRESISSRQNAGSPTRRRAAGQIHALRLGPPRSRPARHGFASARISCCRPSPARARADRGDVARLRPEAPGCAALLVAVLRAEAARAAGARAVPAPDWLLLGRVLQRLGPELSAPHRPGRSPRRARRAGPGSWRRIAPATCRAARAASSSCARGGYVPYGCCAAQSLRD